MFRLTATLIRALFGRRAPPRGPAPLTSAPPPDPRRHAYTYLGKRLLGRGPRDLFMLDSLRESPTLMVGTTGAGKTEMILSMAKQDMAKGRTVVFIDGKADRGTWDKLYYYSAMRGRPFYCLLPVEGLDHLSGSWNPLHSVRLPVLTVAESFFGAYARIERAAQRHGSSYYPDTQRNAFTHLCRALHMSGWAFCVNDVKRLLGSPEALDGLVNLLSRRQAMDEYQEICNIRRTATRPSFFEIMSGFLNHLSLFQHWSLNSYSPEIVIEEIYGSGGVLYIGLPLNAQHTTMSVLGNLVLNQLRALSNAADSAGGPREEVSVFVDEAGSFMDEGVADWVCKVRSSGFRLLLSIQTLGDLRAVGESFSQRITGNTPNLVVFNPNDVATAKWIGELSGHRQVASRSASIVEEPGGETGSGQERMAQVCKVDPDAVLQQRVGQFYLRPAVRLPAPLLVAGSILTDPPPDPSLRYMGWRRAGGTGARGLYMELRDAAAVPPSRPAPPRRRGAGPGAKAKGKAK